jgi:ubiquitin-conjugating enzyme E2 D/E
MNAIRRIQREIIEVIMNPVSDCTFSLLEEHDLLHWQATLAGPRNSPYEGGLFKIEIVFPADYPWRPPKCRFLTKIYHPNINGHGAISLYILNDGWSPALLIPKLIN